MKKANLSEQAMISIIWTSVMSCVEWNKKEELVTEQAIKHLKVGVAPAVWVFNLNNRHVSQTDFFSSLVVI